MIKKIFFAALLLTNAAIYAQENKGKFMINGNGNFAKYKTHKDYGLGTNNSYDKTNQTNGNVNLNFGYFLSNHFAIGVSGGYSGQINKQEFVNPSSPNTNLYKSYTYSAGIFARYNCMIKESKFGFLFQLNANYDFEKNHTKITYATNPNPSTDFGGKTVGSTTALRPGVIYFINQKFSLETLLGSVYYQQAVKTIENNETYKEKNSNFGLDLSMTSIYIGITYYFGGKKTESSKSAE